MTGQEDVSQHVVYYESGPLLVFCGMWNFQLEDLYHIPRKVVLENRAWTLSLNGKSIHLSEWNSHEGYLIPLGKWLGKGEIPFC